MTRRIIFVFFVLAIGVRLYAQWAENKHSEEMSAEEREVLYQRKKTARDADAAVEEWRKQIRSNHGQSEHRNVDIFDAEGYVIVTDRSADQ